MPSEFLFGRFLFIFTAKMKKFAYIFVFLFFFASCQFGDYDDQSFVAQIADTSTYKRSPDTSSQRIMLVGDSMTGVLRWKFRDYCQYNGHKLYVVIWDAANTIWYNRHDTLKYYIEKIKPTYIFIVLGANELFIPNIKKSRKKYVEGIIEQIGDIPFVWVGPPNWTKDSGINDLIESIVGPRRFFPTYKISLNNPHFKRYPDGAHPRPSAAQIWMDSLAKWVMTKSLHPIKFYKPPAKGNMKFRTYYMAPMVDSTKKENDTTNNDTTDFSITQEALENFSL